MKKRIAIIGAGMSGLTLANRLSKIAEVVLFEKSRGVGGRMSTRQADPFTFDHGAQFFTVRDKRFSVFI
jgi:predicted NAD/FAD-dependent oxidoreductase